MGCLLFHSKNGAIDPMRDSFDKYYMPLVEIKECKVLIDNKQFCDQLVKNKQESHEKHLKMSRNDDNTRRNLLGYFYQQFYYKLIVVDLLIQTNRRVSQQINFIRKLEENNGATMFFITGKH